MSDQKLTMRENIKRLGYAHNCHVKLYGQVFQLVSDPIVESERSVFFDGLDRKSGSVKRIPIPLPILVIARQATRTQA